MARKNCNREFGRHTNWDIPGGIRTLDGEPVKAIYHQPTPNQSKRRKTDIHTNALRKLHAKQAELSAC